MRTKQATLKFKLGYMSFLPDSHNIHPKDTYILLEEMSLFLKNIIKCEIVLQTVKRMFVVYMMITKRCPMHPSRSVFLFGVLCYFPF